MDKKLIFGIDFDGTAVSHEFPKVGNDIGAVPVLKRLVEEGHQLILFTMRSDAKATSKEARSEEYPDVAPRNFLSDAVQWFKDNNIPLYGIQENPTQKKWTSSPKPYCHIYIDDAALGCPLTYNEEISDRLFVDWVAVEKYLVSMNVLKYLGDNDS